ncbi:unnamed protein product, partial [Polarella glacialis]
VSQCDSSPPASELRMLRLFGSKPLRRSVPEPPLDPELLEGSGEEGPFDLVAVTDAPGRAKALIHSVLRPLRLRLLRPPTSTEWKFRWFDSERYLLAYVSNLRRRGFGDRLVIYADAFDVAWLNCERNFSRSFDRLGPPMFFGAEWDLYPAGVHGYLPHARSHAAVRRALSRSWGRPMENCRQVHPLPMQWDLDPLEEHETCLAESEAGGVLSSGNIPEIALPAQYVNGGFYGGRAAELEVALRRMLGKLRLLPVLNENGVPFRNNGRTHQYMWNQYFLDHPEQVALDYGGTFVTNLARRSVAARQFGVDKSTGQVKSVIFQKPVCFMHANGGGYADNTFQLVRTAYALGADTTAWAGPPFGHEMDAVAEGGLAADRIVGDRVVIDTGLCFRSFNEAVPVYHGTLSVLYLVTPYNAATFRGLWFFTARPRKYEGGSNRSFDVVEVQQGAITTRPNTGRAKPPNGTQVFKGRNRFDISVFRLRV